MKKNKKQQYKISEHRKKIKLLVENNYKEYFKSIVSIELSISEEDILNRIYSYYMKDDNLTLVSEDIKKISEKLITNNIK